MWTKLWIVLQVLICGITLSIACTFSTNLASRTWRDSDKGDLVFTTNQMTGWSFNYISGPTTVPYSPTWECLNTTTEGSDIILILKSSLTVQYDSTAFYRPFLCMRLTPITDVSYYYYLQYAEQTNLGYERIPIIQEEAVNSVTDPFQAFCLETTNAEYPSSNEYHMLVLKGSENLAIQDCPVAMYELFTYTVVDTNAGTSECGGGDSRLNMCSDIKRMVFNNTLCTTPAAYSANGSLFCLVVRTSGSYTLHTVYNEDSTVDNVNTFLFSCFVSSVTSDGAVSMSVSPRSCTKTQTPATQPQLGNGTTFGLNINLFPVQSILICDFPCSIPTNLANLNWTDSDKGQLQFSTQGMSGWYFHSDGTLQSPSWKCFHTTTVDDSDILILRGDSTFSVYGDIYRPFLCLKLRQITDVSYYYYLLWAEQDRLGYERVTIKIDSEESSISNPYTELCVNTSLSTAYPTEKEFHLLIKEGSESSAIQDCPSTFYGIYAYTVEDKSTGDTFCGSNDTQLDVCADYQRMTINYTRCNTLVAHSASGNLFCVFSLTVGSNVIHTVYNEDLNFDNNNTFRFTCFISTISSEGNLTVSQSPNSCTKTQTPTDQPTLTNGTVVGLNLHLSPFENGLCPIPTPQRDSSSANTVVIIGSVLGSLLLLSLIAAVLICLYCKVCCCKRGAKINTELNNNTINKKQNIQDDNVEETDTLTYNESESPLKKEKKMLESNTDILCSKTVKAEEKDVTHNEEFKECFKSMKEVQHGDSEIDEDLLITPSSIDITSLSHIRTHSRMETPFGMAPDDTHFQENGNIPIYNSFTLPLLQGKSVTNLSSTGVQENKSSKHYFQPLVNERPKTKAEMINKTVANTSQRKESELPDNPAIINSHFHQQNITYMNTFMDLPRKATVGPQNDHEFREKRNYSDKVLSSAKANTVLDIMSKEFGYTPYGGKISKAPNKDIIKGCNGTNDLLESAKTLSFSKNKKGVFLVDAGVEDNAPSPILDDTVEGIAYDEDNQKARKHVHFVSEDENIVREITGHDFEYGVVKGDRGCATEKPISFGSPGDNRMIEELENKDPDNDDEDLEDGGKEARETDNNKDVFTLDHPRLKTAMSVIYSENSEDPDRMSIRGYDL